ncbi:MAG: efflux transporter outer membrane subunit [Rhabdochlamydiaceae bacterium]|nr:efflux transporter outer membrane subunit [Rhabdochlamydiaceae bacterium]
MKKWLLFPLCLLSACNFAPKHSTPDMALPSNWRVDNEGGDTLANSNWWMLLEDEVLNEYIQTALQNNKDLKIAIWRVSEYLAQYQVVRSSLFPQLQLNSSAVRERFPIDLDFLPANVSPVTSDFHLDMSLSYEFDFWGKIRNETSASYSQYLAQVENRRTVVLTLVGSVAQAYVYLTQLDAQLKLAKDIMGSFKQSLEIATYRFEGGITSKIEVDQALSVYEESAAIVEKLEMQVPQQENLLCVLLGETPHSIKRGKTLNQLTLPGITPTGQPQDLLTRRPDILAAENNLKAANANIGVARAAFFPQLSFSTLFGYDSLQLRKLFAKNSQTWIIGGNLLQQVFTGGALVGQLNMAKAEKQELLFQYEQTILKALQEVNNALIGVQQSQKVFKANTREVAALKDYLALSWERYYEGQTQYLTVLDAERKVLSVELDTTAAQADQFLELIDLYKSLGGGWVLEEDQKALAAP